MKKEFKPGDRVDLVVGTWWHEKEAINNKDMTGRVINVHPDKTDILIILTDAGHLRTSYNSCLRSRRRTIDEIAEDVSERWRQPLAAYVMSERKDAILKAFEEYGVEVDE